MAVNNNFIEKIISEVLNAIEDRDELRNATKQLNYHIRAMFIKCLEECFKLPKQLSTKSMLTIDSIIDFIDDQINIGHWSDISVELRRAYTLSSFIKALFYIKFNKTNVTLEILRETLKYVDRGLLMGAPFENNSELLTKVASVVTNCIRKYFAKKELTSSGYAGGNESNQHLFLFENIKAREIEVSMLPSLQQFSDLYFKTHCPVKLQGVLLYLVDLERK